MSPDICVLIKFTDWSRCSINSTLKTSVSTQPSLRSGNFCPKLHIFPEANSDKRDYVSSKCTFIFFWIVRLFRMHYEINLMLKLEDIRAVPFPKALCIRPYYKLHINLRSYTCVCSSIWQGTPYTNETWYYICRCTSEIMHFQEENPLLFIGLTCRLTFY